jgi:trimethylguanosine synthase
LILSYLSDIQCPYGPDLEPYWKNRYSLFERYDEGIQLDENSLHTVMPEKAALSQAQLINAEVIIDGFCGAGGCSIAMARCGLKVIAIDDDLTQLNMAHNNARVYEVAHKIKFIHGNTINLIDKLSADAINLDPPWGWPSIKRKETYKLDDFPLDMRSILRICQSKFNSIIFRVPRNFANDKSNFISTDHTTHLDFLGDRVISKSIFIQSMQTQVGLIQR